VLWHFSPWQLIWLSPVLAGLILSPLTARFSASPVFGRWTRMRGLLVTPEERDPPRILTAAAAIARRLPQTRPPGPAAARDAVLHLGRDSGALERHLSALPAQAEPLPTRLALLRVTAAAKIAHARSQSEALDFLDPAETDALVADRDLLAQWSALPA
ncbi:MAG: glucans biosynthesis glucosyltransferase MdoH, partial [Paracoccus sp. (in: a-proteobacteria)]|nr:glucans biosynthesis glucosyltransferase MdoH [Paracoccus sp. (in: a-proteobacteria)]